MERLRSRLENMEKKKAIQICAIGIVMLGLLLVVHYDFEMSGERSYVGDKDNYLGKEIGKGDVYCQTIKSKGNLCRIDEYFNADQKGSKIKIEVTEKKSNEKLYDAVVDTGTLGADGRIEIILNKALASGKKAEIKITGIDGTKGNSIRPLLCKDEKLPNVKINNQESSAYIRTVLKYHSKSKTWCFIFAVMALICVMLLIFSSRVGSMPVERIFFVCAVLFGGMFVSVNPPLQNPDEYYHFQKSIDVSYGNLSPFYLRTDKNIYELTGPKTIMESEEKIIYANTMKSDSYKEELKKMSMREETARVKSTGGFHPFIAYIPQTLGVLLARLLGMNVLNTLYFARMMNVLLYGVLGYWTIKRIPIGKHIIFALALTPIAISQAASASTDGLCNMLAFLFLAYVLDYTFTEREDLGIKDMLPLAGILIGLAFCKYLYAVIGILVFLIPMKKFGNAKNYWKTFGAIVVPLLLLFVLYYGFVAGNLIQNSTYKENVNPGEQLVFAFDNIKFTIQVFKNTVEGRTWYYLEQFNTLGALNFKLGLLIEIVPAFLLVVVLTDNTSEHCLLNTKQKALLSLTGIGIIALVMFSMYLVWTEVGNEIIEGVQARYFIPALPLLFLGFQIRGIENKVQNYTMKVAAASVFCLFLTIVYMARICY